MNRNEPDVTREQQEIHNPEVTYDATDLSARAVILFLIFLAIGGILISSSLWGVYKYLVGPTLTLQPTTNPLSTSSRQLRQIGGDPALKFPPPRLQPNPVADFNNFRTREEEILNTYGWVDPAHSKVHIPIERAIDLTAAVGLPVRPNATAAAPRNAEPGAPGAAGGINVVPGEGKLPPPAQ